MDNRYYSKTGTGPNLIFLHGWKQDRHTWGGVMEQLNQDFSCWALDLPAFGVNPRPKEAWTPQDYANWVGDFIQENKIESPTIIGHSFGGRVAICLASSLSSLHTLGSIDSDMDSRVRENDRSGIADSGRASLARMTPLSKLILYATPGFREPLPRFTSMAQALSRATKSWTPLQKIPLVQKIREQMRSRDYKELDDLQDIFINTIEFDLSEKMTEIQIPTLLIWGEKDVEVPIKIGRAMHETIANSVLKTIPNGSHFAHLENPTLFAGLVKKFVQNHE